MSDYHMPVLLAEAIENLNIKSGGLYIDCNLGGGGHTKEILERGGKVLGIDMDPEAISNAQETLRGAQNDGKLTAVQGNFAQLESLARENGFEKVDGVLFDLGVSSRQLDTTQRGFSYVSDAPLDMRMSPELVVTASDLVNGLNVGELTKLFEKYGEEKFARLIAKEIVKQRAIKPFVTTQELVESIQRARPRGVEDHTHPAARVFQALRIAVNDELNNLEAALPQAVDLLKPNGRLVVISFHSLEDRIVKNFMKGRDDIRSLADKPIEAGNAEVSSNPRARSSKMRVAEKHAVHR